jgi:hypothetical protein
MQLPASLFEGCWHLLARQLSNSTNNPLTSQVRVPSRLAVLQTESLTHDSHAKTPARPCPSSDYSSLLKLDSTVGGGRGGGASETKVVEGRAARRGSEGTTMPSVDGLILVVTTAPQHRVRG